MFVQLFERELSNERLSERKKLLNVKPKCKYALYKYEILGFIESRFTFCLIQPSLLIKYIKLLLTFC